MTQQELYYLLLNVLACIAIIRIIFREINRYREKRKNKPRKVKQSTNNFQPKKWYPTGWYWDEDKQSWIPPDYLKEESHKKWRWDEEKRIWINLYEDKNK